MLSLQSAINQHDCTKLNKGTLVVCTLQCKTHTMENLPFHVCKIIAIYYKQMPVA